MKTSDLIGAFILKMLDEANGDIELKRNELAQQFGVVPSQINYVISSRFTPEQGFRIESRRGGGGYIRITRVQIDPGSAIMHLVNSMGDTMDYPTARAIIGNLKEQGVLNTQTADVMASAMVDRLYSGLPLTARDILRANILKQMLLHTL